MDSSKANVNDPSGKIAPVVSTTSERLRAIAYSIDTLIPGLYIWLGPIQLCLGGSTAEDSYPGTIHSSVGMAIVLPGYHIYSTYQGDHDLR